MAKTISRIYDAHKIGPIRLREAVLTVPLQELHMSRKNLHVYVISRKMVRVVRKKVENQPPGSRRK